MQNDKKLLYETVADTLIQRIEDGGYAVGQYIPAERDLAEEFQVSRGVIREAIRVMDLKGYIGNFPGGKRKVIRSTQREAEQHNFYQKLEKAKIEEFIDARTYLDDIIVTLACQRATVEDIEQIENIYLRLSSVYGDEDKEMQDEGYDQFHLAIAEAAHNGVIECIYQMATSDMVALRRETLRTKKDRVQMIKEHEDIFLAIKERNILGARLAVQIHNRNIKERYKNEEEK